MGKRSDDFGKKSFKDSIAEKKRVIETHKPVKILKKKQKECGGSTVPGASVIASLISLFIFAIAATVMLPMVANSITLASNQTNMSSSEETLLGLWPLFIIIGGLLAILAAVGLS